MKEGLFEVRIEEGSIEIVEDILCEIVVVMMKLNEYLDFLILCGGVNFIKIVVQNVIVFVIEIGVGNCYVFVDESVDFEMVKRIVINVKI